MHFFFFNLQNVSIETVCACVAACIIRTKKSKSHSSVANLCQLHNYTKASLNHLINTHLKRQLYDYFLVFVMFCELSIILIKCMLNND